MLFYKLQETKDTTRRIADMLDLLQRRDQNCFNSFCKALIANGQEHIVSKYLTTVRNPYDVTDCASKPADHFGFRCLGADVVRRLTFHWNHIVEDMDADDGLMSTLAKNGAFTEVQMNKFRVCMISAI